MSSDGGAASTAPRGRGRGRGRGTNRGKAMRARGRRGVGRGAVFNERLVLEGEASTEMTEEEVEELQMKYARRGLGSNADRYLEPEKTEEEAEEDEYDYDLAEVREKQREQEIEAGEVSVEPNERQDTEYEDDVDHTLAHISSKSLDLSAKAEPKRSMQTIEWDPGLDEMRREIDKAEGMRDLKERFRTKSEKLLPTNFDVRWKGH
ncbi:hypothetical protein DL96DRAFT_279952 [Flagelloscypha sp. PMI_526]|nr:hypothetical protein DL96DRAFT_279952 [Flagelloscypha sp. PMI_526]